MSKPGPNTVLIHIMGKEYAIACPPEEEKKLLDAAQYLDGQMRKIRESGKVIGMERIAVMAALNLSHELLQNQSAATVSSSVQGESLNRLNHKLDSALQRLKQLEI